MDGDVLAGDSGTAVGGVPWSPRAAGVASNSIAVATATAEVLTRRSRQKPLSGFPIPEGPLTSREAVFKAGGVAAIEDALRHFPDDGIVQRVAGAAHAGRGAWRGNKRGT